MKKKLNCVLLVDDNEADNFLHKKILEKSGITDHIEIVMNGKEALDFLTGKLRCGQTESSNCLPELIFLDINMPVMNGWNFLEEYFNTEDVQKSKIIVIILTTSLNPSDSKGPEKILKGSCFHLKPLTLQSINEIMQTHFPDYL